MNNKIDIKDSHYLFWFFVFKFYPRHSFPENEVLLMYASDTKNYPIESLQRAFNEYRICPENEHPPTPGKIIAIIDPLVSEKGRELFAKNLYHKIFTIGRYGDIRKNLGEFEYKILQELPGGSRSLFDSEYSHSIIKSFIVIIERLKNPAKFEEIGKYGNLLNGPDNKQLIDH